MNESEALARLTPRERRCLELVALHYDTGQIAAELGISVATVNGYLADARQKLGARNRKEAARMLGAAAPATPAEPPENGEEPASPPPSEDRGMFERVEGHAPPLPPVDPQNEGKATGWLSRLLYLDRTAAPHQFGVGARSVMIVGLVMALSVALAMSVIAAVGLVSIFTSLRS